METFSPRIISVDVQQDCNVILKQAMFEILKFIENILNADLFHNLIINQQNICPLPLKLFTSTRKQSRGDSYEAVGSVTLLTKRGSLLKSSTMNARNG